MSDRLLVLSSTMSNEHERIREIKYHINQLLSELRTIEPDNSCLENFQPFNITINSSSTTLNNENFLLDNACPYLSRKQAILHSTTYHEYRKNHKRKKLLLLSSPKKNIFSNSICATSTPKHSPNQNILHKPHLTSTPRHSKRQSTNMIPLKRLLYNNKNATNKISNRQRYSTKRSIIPRYSHLNPIDENPQWI